MPSANTPLVLGVTVFITFRAWRNSVLTSSRFRRSDSSSITPVMPRPFCFNLTGPWVMRTTRMRLGTSPPTWMSLIVAPKFPSGTRLGHLVVKLREDSHRTVEHVMANHNPFFLGSPFSYVLLAKL